MDMSRLCNVECVLYVLNTFTTATISSKWNLYSVGLFYIPLIVRLIEFIMSHLLDGLIENETEHEVQRIIMFVQIWFASQWNTSNKSRDLGDLNVWLLNFTSSVNHINDLKK